jgi:hypothetical protein
MRPLSLSLRPIPVLLALASLTLIACDNGTDSMVTGPGKSLPSIVTPIPITTCTVITQPGVYEMAVDFCNWVRSLLPWTGHRHPGQQCDGSKSVSWRRG